MAIRESGGRQLTRGSAKGTRKLSPIAYRSLIWNFTQRDLKSRYRGTMLGWAWALLAPLATVAIYSLVFSLFIRVEPPAFGNGREGIYAVWLLVGMVTWQFLNNSISLGMPSLLGNGPLMQKVYVPSFAPVLAATITVGIQSLIELGIVMALLAVLGNVGWTWLLTPLWLALLLLAAGGCSYMLAVANVYWRDLSQITQILLQLLFFLSPIIYPLTLVPETIFGWLPIRSLLEASPIAQFVIVGRDLLYGLTLPSAGQIGYLAMCTAVILVCARWVFRRWGEDIGEAM